MQSGWLPHSARVIRAEEPPPNVRADVLLA
jgi:hypothetical protein